VDVLFVDEAGQMSLANVLAVSTGAKSTVLLGDPQQLEQPQQGSHPEGTDVSALEYESPTREREEIYCGSYDTAVKRARGDFAQANQKL